MPARSRHSSLVARHCRRAWARSINKQVQKIKPPRASRASRRARPYLPTASLSFSRTTLKLDEMPRSHLVGRVIALLTSFLFFYGGQAHLTDEYTPDLAAQIVLMSHGAEKAWWFFGLDAEQVSMGRFASPARACGSRLSCSWTAIPRDDR